MHEAVAAAQAGFAGGWLLGLILLPMAAALLCYFISKKHLQGAYALAIGASALAVLGSGLLFIQAWRGGFSALAVPDICQLGLTLRADGFRSLYALIASFMWLVSALFTPEYLRHGHARGRYLFFLLMTLSATLGVFLSDDLYTAFIFFEIMSFTSYPWVAHEQHPQAMRAAATYLAIAVLGGMCMLMGLFLLQPLLGTLAFGELAQAAQALPDKSRLYLPAALILIGFGAKAGMFPLHVWLPKAHPVAPAPASALLSGILTKIGIFGVAVVSCRVLFGDGIWDNVLVILGLLTMMIGAFLALLAVDLKRTLACSSMSQIGFIVLGLGMEGLLVEHNAYAAQGVVLHMVNHSLIKLVLFLAAGTIYINLHHLNLNDIRGFGRGKPFLHICFAVGAASISAVPMFSGYVSKTLLHESILEYVHLLHDHQGLALWYSIEETLFVVTGGFTFAYMLKLYIAVFWEKHTDATQQRKMDGMRQYLTRPSRLALGTAAAVLLVWGLLPYRVMTPAANLSLDFFHAHPPHEPAHYFADAALLDDGKSLAIGLLLYLTVVRGLLMKKENGRRVYVDRKPAWLDLEDMVFRPALQALVKAGVAVARVLDMQMDYLYPALRRGGEAAASALDSLPEKAVNAALLRGGQAAAQALDAAPEKAASAALATTQRGAALVSSLPDGTAKQVDQWTSQAYARNEQAPLGSRLAQGWRRAQERMQSNLAAWREGKPRRPAAPAKGPTAMQTFRNYWREQTSRLRGLKIAKDPGIITAVIIALCFLAAMVFVMVRW